MSIEFLNGLFELIANYQGNWTLELVKFRSNRGKMDYYCREIQFENADTVPSLIGDIACYYLSEKGISSFTGVEKYAGDKLEKTIFKLDSTNELIYSAYNQLMYRLAKSDHEDSIEQNNFQAYVVSGSLLLDETPRSIKMFSIHSPFMNMTNKYVIGESKKFRRIENKVLTLKKQIDVIIVDNDIYFLSLDGEKLFDMERTIKTMSDRKVKTIIESGLLSNADSFKSVSKRGHYPRWLSLYDTVKLATLSREEKRKEMASTFGMKLNDENMFDTDDENTSIRLIKFLCDKAMLDPGTLDPVEVSAAKSWS